MVFLGTPHHGAPLERAGHGVDRLLEATPYAAPFARLGKLRSAGITDLRHGTVIEEEGVCHDRFARRADHRQPVPLPSGVRCFAAATSLGRAAGDPKGRWLGDGLVPLDSALGHHRDPRHCLAFPDDRCWIGYGIGHLDQLSSLQVAAQLLKWLDTGPG